MKYFSHRRVHGVSLGITTTEHEAVLAIAFRNQQDMFNRRLANTILRGRLLKALQSKDRTQSMTFRLPTSKHISPRDLIHLIRQLFKPDPLEIKSDFLSRTAFDKRRIHSKIAYIQNIFIDAVDELDP